LGGGRRWLTSCWWEWLLALLQGPRKSQKGRSVRVSPVCPYRWMWEAEVAGACPVALSRGWDLTERVARLCGWAGAQRGEGGARFLRRPPAAASLLRMRSQDGSGARSGESGPQLHLSRAGGVADYDEGGSEASASQGVLGVQTGVPRARALRRGAEPLRGEQYAAVPEPPSESALAGGACPPRPPPRRAWGKLRRVGSEERDSAGGERLIRGLSTV
jgi:hypothetical protein